MIKTKRKHIFAVAVLFVMLFNIIFVSAEPTQIEITIAGNGYIEKHPNVGGKTTAVFEVADGSTTWVKYSVEAPQAGLYDVKMELAIAAYNEFCITNETDSGTSYEGTISQTTNSGYEYVTTWTGSDNTPIQVYLKEGTNVIKIASTNHGVKCNLKTIVFTKNNEVEPGPGPEEPEEPEEPEKPQQPEGEKITYTAEQINSDETIPKKHNKYREYCNGFLMYGNAGHYFTLTHSGTAGKYNISVLAACGENASTCIIKNERTQKSVTVSIPKTADYYASTLITAEGLDIKNGDLVTFKVNRDCAIAFEKIEFVKAGEYDSEADPKPEPDPEPEPELPIYGEISLNGQDYSSQEGVTNATSNKETVKFAIGAQSWVIYSVKVPEDGIYNVTLNYSTDADNWFYLSNESLPTPITVSGILSASDSKYTDASTWTGSSGSAIQLQLNEGVNEVKLKSAQWCQSTCNLKKISFTLINYNMNVHELYVGENSVSQNDFITPSTDTIKISMTNPVTTEKITDEIVISDEKGNVYDYDASVSKHIIKVELKDSLLPSTDYKVAVNRLSCKYGDMESTDTVTFTTGEEKNDGVSTFEVKESAISNEDITVNGVIYASHKKPINGRSVKAYISKKGASDKTYLDTFVSADGGKITLDLQIPSGSYSDIYTVYIEPQYTDVVENIDFIYVDDTTEAEIAADFKDATDVDKVETAFLDNKEHFPNDLDADIQKLSNKDAFYSHFIKYELTDMNSLYAYYNKMFSFESLVQNGAETVLYNETTCNNLGIDYNKVNLIQNKKEGFATAVDEISKTDIDEYISILNKVIDEYFEKESQKENVTLSLSSVNVTYGQGFKKDIVLSSAQTDLKKAVLKLECNQKEIIDSILHSETKNGDIKIKKDENSATVEITFKNLYDKSDLFTLSFTGAVIGTHNIKYSGKLVFDFNGYDITTDVTPGNFSVFVNNVISQSSSNKTNESSGSIGGGSSFTPSVSPEIIDKEKEILFTDISSYLWAEESITYLADKGVISKPEDKKYRPGDYITREEFVKMIACLLNINNTASTTVFSDVSKDHWAYRYIVSATSSGLINGMGDGSFGIGEYITREQMATIASRILDKYSMNPDLTEVEVFSDENDISEYAVDSVKKMKYYGIINGVGNNMYAPKSNATRAETAKIIYGLAKVVGL